MNQTYLRILTAIESFASEHLQVKKFASDFPEQLPNFATKDETYPILFVSPSSSIFNQYSNQFDLTIYCYDIIQKDRDNINTILSDTNQILNDLTKWLKDGDIAGIDLINSPVVTPINNDLLDYTAGWQMTISLSVDTYSICEIPFNEQPAILDIVNGIVYSKYLTCETLSECDTIVGIEIELSALTVSLNGKLEEAPEDGKTYGRQDASWVEVTSTTGIPTLQQVTDSGNTTTNNITISGVSESTTIQAGNYSLIGENYYSTVSTTDFVYGNLSAETETVIKVAPQTQNTTFNFESEGGNKSIATREWVTANTSSTISGASDVQLSGLSNSEILTYNSTSSKWENKTVEETLGYKPVSDLQFRRKGYTIFDEFTTPVTSVVSPFIRTAINSGTIAVNTAVFGDNMGLLGIASTTTAINGGGTVLMNNVTTARSMRVIVGMQFDIIMFSNAFSSNVWYRFGFISGTNNQNDIVDGFYFEWNGANIVGKTATSSVRSSSSSYTMTSGDWYHLRCKLTTASLVEYEIYNMNGTLLFNTSLTTNIPTLTSGVQAGFIGYNTVAENKTMCALDYIAATYPPMNRGALT